MRLKELGASPKIVAQVVPVWLFPTSRLFLQTESSRTSFAVESGGYVLTV